MKMKLFLVLCIFVNTNICLATPVQTDTLNSGDIVFIINIPGKQSFITSNNFLDGNAALDIHFLRGQQYDALLKHLKAKAVALVQLKPGVKVLTLIDFFNKYHIPEKDRKSPIVYNEEVVKLPETILITSNQIKAVSISNTKKGSVINITGVDLAEIKKLKDQKKRGEPFVN